MKTPQTGDGEHVYNNYVRSVCDTHTHTRTTEEALVNKALIRASVLQRTRSSKVGGEMHSHESDIYYGASFLFLSNYTSVEGVGWPCQITV